MTNHCSLTISSVNKALIFRLVQPNKSPVKFVKNGRFKLVIQIGRDIFHIDKMKQVFSFVQSIESWSKFNNCPKKYIIEIWSGQPKHSCGQAIETLSVHFIHDKIQCIKYILFVWTNGKYALLEPSLMKVKAFLMVT